NEIQKILARIWHEVLGVEKEVIGIDTNFFELGGHSLNATVMAAKIHKNLKVKLPLVEVFKTPFIRDLARIITGMTAGSYESIEPIEKKEYYLASSAQKRLYFLQQMDLQNTVYNMPEVIPLTGEIDIAKLEETFKKLIKRHESLRTSFKMIGDEPRQRIHHEVEFEFIKTPEYPFVRPFDLSQPPLLRVGLKKTGNKNHLLLVDMHHIIADGVSQDILAKDFASLYANDPLPPLRLRYKDICQWQNSEREKQNLEQQEAYWLKVFDGEIPVLDIPTDYTRPKIQDFEGNTLHFEISRQCTHRLKSMVLEENVTAYMVLLSVYNILLSRLSGQEDIVVGTAVAGRRHPDLEKIIGMFVNTLPLRNYPNSAMTFNEFLADVKKRTLEAFENQVYPFEE
ncbi:MAG: non-ribosomal peptide synthetase, partial [Candidatus Aminicenantes bacterium]